MSDDDSLVDPRQTAGPDRHGETLLYDFAKFLTTLSLIALGGVLTVTQTADPGELRPRDVGLTIASIAIGGVMALSVASGIVVARSRGREPSRNLRLYANAATVFLGIGTGIFFRTWWATLQ